MSHDAFVQNDMLKRKDGAGQIAVQGQKRPHGPRPAIEPCHGNMRREGPRFALYACTRQQAFHSGVQFGNRFLRRDPRPDHVGPAPMFELADARYLRVNRRGMKVAQYRGDIIRLMPIHRADEAQCQVQLFVTLPTRAANPVHGRE